MCVLLGHYPGTNQLWVRHIGWPQKYSMVRDMIIKLTCSRTVSYYVRLYHVRMLTLMRYLAMVSSVAGRLYDAPPHRGSVGQGDTQTGQGDIQTGQGDIQTGQGNIQTDRVTYRQTG